MLRSFATLAVLAAMLIAVPSWAGTMEGKVQSIDTSERTITLDNGTKIWLGDSVAVDSVKEGAQVNVSYEEKDGKPVATSVDTK
jgi:hypothetical protein